MAFIVKQESEDIQIAEVFSLKQEDAEEQTDLMALKEENEERKEIEETNQYERRDCMVEEKSTRTETYSVQKTESNKNLTCHECGKSFKLKGHLKEHMKVHTGGRPFTCRECGTGFNKKGDLKVHMRMHTRGNPYTCRQCGKSFIRKGNLKNHVNTHTQEKSNTCDQCGSGFRFKESLDSQKRRTHLGEDCFVCQCGKSFSSKASLCNQNQKQFICTVCGDSFLQAGNLKSHSRIHTGEKPFKNVSDIKQPVLTPPQKGR